MIFLSLVITFDCIAYLFYGDQTHNYKLYVKRSKKISSENSSSFTKDSSLITRNFTQFTNERKIAHPYLGYTFYPSPEIGFNRDGFRDFTDFQKINSANFVIGIFGGSVASEFARSLSDKDAASLLGKLSEINPIFHNFPNIKFLNFAISAYKQPQQFIAATLFSKNINFSINIDGYNEIVTSNGLEYPTLFPQYSPLLYSKNDVYLKKYFMLQEAINNRLNFTLQIKESKLLSKSKLVHLFWKSYLKLSKHKEKEIYLNLKKHKVANSNYYSPKDYNHARSNKANVWKEYIKKQYDFLNSQKIPSLFFLQPNQYVKNSKKYSNEELQKFIFTSNKNVFVSKEYENLKKITLNFNQSGLPIFDLTKIFSNTKATTYRDNICHLNKLGNKIMKAHIFKKIIHHYKNN